VRVFVRKNSNSMRFCEILTFDSGLHYYSWRQFFSFENIFTTEHI